ncbi:MAG: hypothetical protein QM723_40850 [Myxococcaceae bacterium]
MASQAVSKLLEESPAADGQLKVRLELVCGCVIEKTVAADRVIDTVDGLRLPVGKYSCPLDHPVQKKTGALP